MLVADSLFSFPITKFYIPQESLSIIRTVYKLLLSRAVLIWKSLEPCREVQLIYKVTRSILYESCSANILFLLHLQKQSTQVSLRNPRRLT